MEAQSNPSLYAYAKMVFSVASACSGIMGFTHTVLFIVTGTFDVIPKSLDVAFFSLGIALGVVVVVKDLRERRRKTKSSK